MSMTTMDINYQLVHPNNHRANNAEKKIQMFNNHFIAVLCSVDENFHLQLWEILLQQATITMNLLRKSRIHSHLLAYTHIFGEFDYNCTRLAPPGTKVVIHNMPKDITSWEPYGGLSWYSVPAMKHYRVNKRYTPITRAERILETLEFTPGNLACQKFHL